MTGGEIVLATLVGVAVLGRVFFGKGLLWLPVKLVRGLLYVAVSSVVERDRNPRRWR